MTNIFESEEKNSAIIKNEDILNYDYVPKTLQYREGQVNEISSAIKPMLDGGKGTNLFIFGSPGIGKTASTKLVLRELQEYTDEVTPIYVNCWGNRTKYFIFSEMANQMKLSFTTGKSAEHVLQQIEHRLTDKNAVFVLDEIDKAEESDFLYQILEKFPKSTIMLLSNSKDYTVKMDSRIRSRLMLRALEFKEYSLNEIHGILKDRAKLALKPNSIDPSILKQIANITHSKGDIRVGLFLLRESAKNAENRSGKTIAEEDVKEIIEEMDNLKISDGNELSKDEEMMVECVRGKNGGVSGEIFDEYILKGGELSYRSFKRYIERLEKLGIVRTEETGAGFKGKSTIIFLRR